MGVLDELDEEALVEILTKPRNAIVKQYQRLLGVRRMSGSTSRRRPSEPSLAKPWLARSAPADSA